MMNTTLSASAVADAISLEAYYVGPSVEYGTKIPKSAILVKATYADGTKDTVFDWQYIGSNIITTDNPTLGIQYQTQITIVEVPLIYTEVISFECHYHGGPVLIGTEFDPKDLHARALYGNGHWEELHSYQYSIPDRLVTQKGNNNIYTATHPSGLEDRFVVFGYDVDDSDMDFKIYQVNDNIEIDVTDSYYPLFYHDLLDKIYVTAMRLNKILPAGIYRLVLPKNTGLNCKHASEWKVIKDLNNNIKITPIKFYHEEDFKNG